MQCPRCAEDLRERTYEADIRVDECPTCRGLWLDRGELVRIEETSDGTSPHDAAVIDTVARAQEQARQMSRPEISCPKCGQPMTKREAHPSSQVVIDVCQACPGAWLDGGEVQSLERFCEGMAMAERQSLHRGFFARLASLFGS